MVTCGTPPTRSTADPSVALLLLLLACQSSCTRFGPSLMPVFVLTRCDDYVLPAARGMLYGVVSATR